MSRVQRRSGTKSLVCFACGTSGGGKAKMSFRGRTRERLRRHLREVHKQ